jgi:hypothetical protein
LRSSLSGRDVDNMLVHSNMDVLVEGTVKRHHLRKFQPGANVGFQGSSVDRPFTGKSHLLYSSSFIH